MDHRICPLVSGRNGLLVHCIGEDCRACRTAVLVPDGESVSICTACSGPQNEGGR